MIIPKHNSPPVTIFTEMSLLAAQEQAINLSQGFPDYPIDPLLADLMHQAVKEGHNQYAPMAGLPLLREQISAGFKRKYQLSADPLEEITITPGATAALHAAISALVQSGDEVILLEPAYDSYVPCIEMCGGVPISVPLVYPGFSVDWDRVEAAVSEKTKAIIINTPHNPTGYIWSSEDYEALIRLVEQHGVYVISDEVYHEIIFEENIHQPVFGFPQLRDKCISIYSFGKSLNATGWKVGYMIANPILTRAVRAVHQYVTFSVNTPSQWTIARYLAEGDTDQISLVLEQKRNLFLSLIKDTGFKILQPAAGSYFQIVDYSQLSDLPEKEFAIFLTRKYKVATIPLSSFYKEPNDKSLIRFCFAKREETLRQAALNLRNLVADLKNPVKEI